MSSSQWPHFSATNVYLGRHSWSYLQWSNEPEEKLMNRLKELVTEVLVDVPHLNVIIKRDLKERMQPWQIATLPLSHQVCFSLSSDYQNFFAEASRLGFCSVVHELRGPNYLSPRQRFATRSERYTDSSRVSIEIR